MTQRLPTWDLTGRLTRGVTLLEASAGTGKTFTIAALVLRLVAEEGIPIDQILVVTFTRAATAELSERIRRRLVEGHDALADDAARSEDPVLRLLQDTADAREERSTYRRRVRDAIERFDQATLSTIHGFCQRMLQQHAFESRAPLDLELVTDEGDLVAEVADDLYASMVHDAPDALLELLAGPAKLDRAGTRALVKAALKDPDQAISPDPEGEAPDPAACAASVLERFDDLVADLPEAFSAAEGTVLAPRQRTYVEKKAREHLPTLRAWLEAVQEGGSADLGEKAREWFSPAGLASKSVDPSAPFSHPFFEALQQVAAAEAEVVAFRRARLAAQARVRFEAVKARARVQTFQDLLRGLAARLGPEADPQGRDRLRRVIGESFQAALIDEFQDTDDHQWTIFREVFGRGDHHLYLIGDPKQAIYGFRGANVHVYRAAAEQAAHRYTMDRNWRSDQALLEGVHTLMARTPLAFGDVGFDFVEVSAPPDRQDVEGIRFSGSPAPCGLERPVSLRWLASLGDEGKALGKGETHRSLEPQVASDVAALLSARPEIEEKGSWVPLRPRHLAVLVRKGAQARALQKALAAVGVPSVLTGAESVMASDEAQIVLWWLDALAQPSGRASRSVASTAVFGWTAHQLAALADEEPEALAAWDGWMASLVAWRELLRRDGLHRAFRQALHDTGAWERLLSQADGARVLTNLMHVTELVQAAASRDRLGLDGLRRWLGTRRAADDLDREEREIRLDRDDDAVQIMTVHRAKGLEFPVCFVPYLWDARTNPRGPELLTVPSEVDPQRRVLDVRPDKNHPIKEARLRVAAREEHEEALRLMYVAVTRARHRVVVYGAAVKGIEDSALGWALARDAGHRPDSVEVVEQAAEALDAVACAPSGRPRIRFSPAEEEMAGAWSEGASERPDPASLGVRSFTRRDLERSWRRHSYSALARFAGHDAIEDALRGRDRDDPSQVDPGLAEVAPAPSEDAVREVPLARFPGGAEAGIALHAMLEHLDFVASAADRSHVSSVVVEQLVRGGFPAEVWADGVVEGLQAVVSTPLGGPLGRLRLADIPKASRLDELRFDVPLAGGLSHGRHAAFVEVQVDAVVDALAARRGDPAIPEAWFGALDGLRGRSLSGFLTGAIDLVFCVPTGPEAGRWWVVDHKSNKVAPTAEGALYPSAFSQDRLRDEMALHHYFLQYHLYLVALHRYLSWRLPDYDYDRHVGGAAYLFLRGMIGPDTPQTGGHTHGVFIDRPPREVVEAIASAFETTGGADVGAR